MKIPFDKVYCISYCCNIEKQNNMRKVMKYLGINFEFIYGADYTNLEILKHKDFLFFKDWDDDQSYKDKFNFRNYTHFIGASYDHYTAVMHAYESGANSVLIMEDDCAFINDVSYIEWAFNNYPKDADIVKFGYITLKNIKDDINVNQKNKYIKMISEFSKNRYFIGSQLYCLLNRNIMETYINHQQHNFCMCDLLFYKLKCKCYSLLKPLALDSLPCYLVNNKEEYSLLESIS